MNDSQMEGAPVVKKTDCRVGAHSFTWTGSLEPSLRCSCGTYTWALWREEMRKAEVGL